MRYVISSGVLEGSDRRMAFTCSLPLLSANKYHMAGQLVQMEHSTRWSRHTGTELSAVPTAGW